MKITSIDVMQLKTRSVGMFWDPVICRVNTDAGVYGYGEAALAYGIGSSAAAGALKDFSGLVIGMHPIENEVIWNKLHRETMWAQNGGAAFFAAISAIDMAVWDIKGKFYDQPVHVLLGGKLRSKLRSYASQLHFGWGSSLEEATSLEDYDYACRRALDEGFDAVKIDYLTFDSSRRRFRPEETTRLLPPSILDLVESRLEQTRRTMGSGDIIIEAHSNTDVASAIQIGKRAEKYGIFFYEEPTDPSPLLHKRVADAVSIPLASGERIYGRGEYVPYIEQGILGVVQPDLGTCGGITEAKKIGDMASTYNVGVQVHACGTGISTAAALQVEAALPSFVIHEHHVINRMKWNKELCCHDYQPVDGSFDIPDIPGIGNELSDFALNNARVHTVSERRERLS
ncbi:MAG: mandelate racemase/muconate lactonizing enzyme family protein [Corynebacterium sp.]|uniref:mandelate racemase/muconate lactonizing enzyme family protein n=1 Tax=unclassified Corynebacterium TaxID=2624378 RepID=UPI00096A0952|nr:mandelate racemase/muconate lactonizing enzyme family protein [Corynebacterium sp. CNJ-954]OLT53689.1 hypothetical protein BJF89_02385 [Corynebacterium sp. CNJ-954]